MNCRRCGGKLWASQDRWGHYQSCLMCGYVPERALTDPQYADELTITATRPPRARRALTESDERMLKVLADSKKPGT